MSITIAEFRIGSYFKSIKADGLVGGYRRCRAIHEAGALIAMVNGKERQYTMGEMVGVELTAELLEKCGFVLGKNDIYEYGDIYVVLGRYSNVGKVPVKFLEYLHQLQNLFYCIYGEELEISL